MKIECSKQKLQKAVTIADRATSHNLSLPVLRNLILEAQKNKLVIKSTNLEIGLEIDLPAKVESEGITSCNPTTLSSFLANLKEEDKITIELENNNLLIKTGTYKTLIKSEEYEDFPLIPKIISGNKFKIKNTDLVYGLKSVVYAAAVSDIKPEISSVYIYQSNNDLVFVATDSFRLAEKKLAILEGDKDVTLNLIIPLKNATEIIKVFEGEDGELELSSDGNQLSIVGSGIHLTSRLIDGIYPDYRQIMPKSSATTITLNKDDLGQVLKMANIFSGKFSQIKLDVDVENQQLVVYSANADIGESTALVKAKIEGENFSAYYNARYILESFQSIPALNLLIGITESNRPLLIQSTDNRSFSYIIMPVNR